jgi:hypothetical protein
MRMTMSTALQWITLEIDLLDDTLRTSRIRYFRVPAPAARGSVVDLSARRRATAAVRSGTCSTMGRNPNVAGADLPWAEPGEVHRRADLTGVSRSRRGGRGVGYDGGCTYRLGKEVTSMAKDKDRERKDKKDKNKK